MGENTIATVVVGKLAGYDIQLWVPILIAFLTGLAFGWIIWGGRKDDEDEMSPSERVRAKAAMAQRDHPEEDDLDDNLFDKEPSLIAGHAPANDDPAHDEPTQDNQAEDDAPLSRGELSRLRKLEGELKKARAQLEKETEATQLLKEELNALDKAVNRANGRLKLVKAAVKKAAKAS